MPKTIIILHGWGHNSLYWETMISMLERDFRVVFFDMPGFGIEPLVGFEWGIPEYAKWVKGRIEKIEGDKIILGHSFGGRIATFIASSKPKWLKGLILSGAPSLYRPSRKTKLKIFLFKVLKKLKIKNMLVLNKTDLSKADSSGMGKIFRKVVPFDQTELLQRIEVPTLMIWGENDLDVPLKIAREMKSLIKNSRLEVIDSVGHNSFMENPNLFYGITKKFIESL